MAALWCSSTSLAFSPHSILSRDHIMPARSSEPRGSRLHHITRRAVEQALGPSARSAARKSGRLVELEGCCGPYPDRDGDQVGAGERGGGREPVDATGHLFELAAVPKVVQRPRVKAQTNGVAGAEHSFVFGEHMACLDETGVGNWIEPADMVSEVLSSELGLTPRSSFFLRWNSSMPRVAVRSLKTETHRLPAWQQRNAVGTG